MKNVKQKFKETKFECMYESQINYKLQAFGGVTNPRSNLYFNKLL